MLDFRLPVWPYNIETTSVELLDPKNTGIAVGISILSHLQAKILGVEITPSLVTYTSLKSLVKRG